MINPNNQSSSSDLSNDKPKQPIIVVISTQSTMQATNHQTTRIPNIQSMASSNQHPALTRFWRAISLALPSSSCSLPSSSTSGSILALPGSGFDSVGVSRSFRSCVEYRLPVGSSFNHVMRAESRSWKDRHLRRTSRALETMNNVLKQAPIKLPRKTKTTRTSNQAGST